ncbi:MAG: SDR family NAD(P)-dependent oxidoreductase [Verrucomicrobiota bacterium]
MSQRTLENRAALVTGASKGLGKCMAIALAKAGAKVALASRDLKLLNETAAEIRGAGGTAEAFQVDVTDEQQVVNLKQAVIEKFGTLHILVNNAGINIRKPLVDYSLEEWRKVMDTNLTSAFLMCHYFVPHMKGHGYGRILNLTSIMSHVALVGRVAYCSSKTGLLGFTRALALELAPDNITVNGISPGPHATEMNQVVIQNPEANREFISKIPQGRWGRVEDIGALALFLCSEDAAFITGTDILIDGGWCAQ